MYSMNTSWQIAYLKWVHYKIIANAQYKNMNIYLCVMYIHIVCLFSVHVWASCLAPYLTWLYASPEKMSFITETSGARLLLWCPEVITTIRTEDVPFPLCFSTVYIHAGLHLTLQVTFCTPWRISGCTGNHAVLERKSQWLLGSPGRRLLKSILHTL